MCRKVSKLSRKKWIFNWLPPFRVQDSEYFQNVARGFSKLTEIVWKTVLMSLDIHGVHKTVFASDEYFEFHVVRIAKVMKESLKVFLLKIH